MSQQVIPVANCKLNMDNEGNNPQNVLIKLMYKRHFSLLLKYPKYSVAFKIFLKSFKIYFIFSLNNFILLEQCHMIEIALKCNERIIKRYCERKTLKILLSYISLLYIGHYLHLQYSHQEGDR